MCKRSGALAGHGCHLQGKVPSVCSRFLTVFTTFSRSFLKSDRSLHYDCRQSSGMGCWVQAIAGVSKPGRCGRSDSRRCTSVLGFRRGRVTDNMQSSPRGPETQCMPLGLKNRSREPIKKSAHSLLESETLFSIQTSELGECKQVMLTKP